MYRIEEVPKEEEHLSSEEMLVPVTHFYKEMHNAFGIPFFLKITNKETYASIRQRIKNRLNVPDKEWEKVQEGMGRVYALGFTDVFCCSLFAVQVGGVHGESCGGSVRYGWCGRGQVRGYSAV